MVIQCLVGEDKNFVTEPMLHGKPMQFSQHRDNFKKIWSNLRLLDIWASCQISKIAGAHAPGMPGTFSPPPWVSDSDMHHGTCVTHVPWCMPGSLTHGFLRIRRRGKSFPAFPAHAQPSILRIWQEAHSWLHYSGSTAVSWCGINRLLQ